MKPGRILVVAHIATVGAAAWALAELGYLSDSLVDADAPAMTVAGVKRYTVDLPRGRRRVSEITFATEDGGPVNLLVTLPLADSQRPLPVMLVLDGLEPGAKPFRNVPDPGPNAFVIYQYPRARELYGAEPALGQFAAVVGGARAVPTQLLAIVRWLRSQPWADADRVSLLGYSLGAVFVPVVQRRLSRHGLQPVATVIAFGGAGLYELLASNLRLDGAWTRKTVALALAAALDPLAPSRHLPYMDGDFLVITGHLDERFPPETAARAWQLTPEPKTQISLELGHLDANDPQMIADIAELSFNWLTERGAIDRLPE